MPDHAAVDTAVQLAQGDYKLKHAEADQRGAAAGRPGADAILKPADAFLDTPDWLEERWVAQYGEDVARRIAEAHRSTASVDIVGEGRGGAWAERLGGALLPTGSIRLLERIPVRDLPGYDEGDGGFRMPPRLCRRACSRRGPGNALAIFARLPAARPAQLAALGAEVVAVDRSAKRLVRLEQNLARLNLKAETIAVAAEKLDIAPFDAILLDAPCSATGTIRRHPDVTWTKGEDDLRKLTACRPASSTGPRAC